MRKRILITGASAGLGEEMARQFGSMGRDLALCARRGERLEALRAEVISARPEVDVAVRGLDVTDHDAVFRVFGELRDELGGLDRIIVNAGLGKGQPVGTGWFAANRQTAETNFVAALAQCEAAMEIFREQRSGHLVVISSMSAMRGLPRNLTTYAASKAGVAALAEGIRADTLGTGITVTTVFPGYIRSEMNSRAGRRPLLVDTKPGVASMVKAIERERARACTPSWPWTPLGFAMRHLPLGWVGALS